MAAAAGAAFANLTLTFAAVGVLSFGVYAHFARSLPSGDEIRAWRAVEVNHILSPCGVPGNLGDVVRRFGPANRIHASFDSIPKLVRDAFVAAEDQRFWTHHGVDAPAVVRAVLANAGAMSRGEDALQGGSTIVQQVIKNLAVGSERTLERKAQEAILALRLSRDLPREKILEIYLNEIYLGRGAYGVRIAAARWFGKNLDELGPEEAAFLAALPKAPAALDPSIAGPRAIARRNYVLTRMAEDGYIPAGSLDALLATDLVVIGARVMAGSTGPFDADPLDAPNEHGSPGARDAPADLRLDEATPQLQSSRIPHDRPAHWRWWIDQAVRDADAVLGSEIMERGGMAIVPSIDPTIQEAAFTALARVIDERSAASKTHPAPPVRFVRSTDVDTPDAQSAIARFAERAISHPGATIAVISRDQRRLTAMPISGDNSNGFALTGETVDFADNDLARWQPASGRAAVVEPGDLVLIRIEEGRARLAPIPSLEGAMMVMEARTGRVLALVGGRDTTSAFNRATQAMRQPGSLLKTFTYLAHLQAGGDPEDTVIDEPITLMVSGKPWSPQNADGRHVGPITLSRALSLSRNVPAVRLGMHVGGEKVATLWRSLGIYPDNEFKPSYLLGARETHLSDLVAAHASLVNGGGRVTPVVIDTVNTHDGSVVWSAPRSPGYPLIDRKDGTRIVGMLRLAVTEGTARRSFADIDIEIAGKTGTSNGSRDAWFIGVTGDLVIGCWIGNDDFTSMGKGAYGGTLCTPAVAELLIAIQGVRPTEPLPVPPVEIEPERYDAEQIDPERSYPEDQDAAPSQDGAPDYPEQGSPEAIAAMRHEENILRLMRIYEETKGKPFEAQNSLY